MPLVARAVRAARAVTTLTEDQARRVRAKFPDLAAPVLVVPHGVDVGGPRDAAARAATRTALGVGSDAPLIVHVAGLRREKGFPEAWDLVDRLRGAVPTLRYVHAGPVLDRTIGPGADTWFATRPWATRLGEAARDRVLDVVAAATCTFHASTIEGLSNALLESMALGVPPLARDIAASRAALADGVSGILFRTDAEAVEGLRRLSHDTSLRRRLGDAAAATATLRFSPAAELAGYVRAYEIATSRA